MFYVQSTVKGQIRAKQNVLLLTTRQMLIKGHIRE